MIIFRNIIIVMIKKKHSNGKIFKLSIDKIVIQKTLYIIRKSLKNCLISHTYVIIFPICNCLGDLKVTMGNF